MWDLKTNMFNISEHPPSALSPCGLMVIMQFRDKHRLMLMCINVSAEKSLQTSLTSSDNCDTDQQTSHLKTSLLATVKRLCIHSDWPGPKRRLKTQMFRSRLTWWGAGELVNIKGWFEWQRGGQEGPRKYQLWDVHGPGLYPHRLVTTDGFTTLM